MSPDGHMLGAMCLSDGVGHVVCLRMQLICIASHVVCLHMQLICMAKKQGTKVINVVRRQDVVQELKDVGYASLMSRLPAFLFGTLGCLASSRAGPCAERSVNMTSCFRLFKVVGVEGGIARKPTQQRPFCLLPGPGGSSLLGVMSV